MSPLIGHLVAQRLTILFIELNDVIDAVGVLSNQGALLEQREDVGQVGLGGESLDVLKKLVLGDANKGVFILRALAGADARADIED